MATMNEKKWKKWNQLIAIILAVVLAVPTVYIPARAEEEEITEADTLEEWNDTGESEQEPAVVVESEDTSEETTDESYTILSEVEEKREEDSKTFLLDDGSFMVAQYGIPVHYEDENGQW